MINKIADSLVVNRPYPDTIRKQRMIKKVVIVDGQPGCGKTMLSPIVASLDRVELIYYVPEIENICALRYLEKIHEDAAIAMIQIQADLIIYETMMSRRTNFRPADISSAFQDQNTWRYIRRLFQKGDETIPGKIERDNPITHFTTHNLLAFSKPVFSAFGNNVVLIEVVRHPLYMIKQQALNMERTLATSRDFHIYIDYNGVQLPYYTLGWEPSFLKSNSIEKTIYTIDKITKLALSAKDDLIKNYGAQVLTIPFEKFVIEPWPYMSKIEEALETKITSKTRKMMKKQKVPRKLIADGLDLKIYRRCGWKPAEKGSNEEQELEIRRQSFAKEASSQAMRVFDELCAEYEKKHLQ